jgi:hypothetical protein
MNNNEIDKLIEDSIGLGLNNLNLRDEVFTRVKENINNEENRNNYKALKIGFSRSNSFKAVVSFMCAVIVFCSLSLVISPNARVFAADAINAIKTIFVYDEKGQIVEMSQKDPVFTVGGCSTTTLNDSEIEKKLGYKVILPENLSDGFMIRDKALGVSLQKQIDYETGEKLRLSIQEAVNDDIEFNKLKEYNPIRSITAFYKNQEGTIWIIVNKSVDEFDKFIEAVKKSKTNGKVIKLGSVNGIWTEGKIPNYPRKTNDNIGSSDMTQKPTGTTPTYGIIWVSDGLRYHLGTIDGYKLTQEMGVRIAETFMESQK